MSAENLFSGKDIKPIDPERKRDLLDELNLPPKLVTFIRTNVRNLQIAVICIVVVVLGWVLYNQYAEKQESNGASLLASALQETSVEQKIRTLENVISEYSRTDAALWSRVELAHLDYQAGRFTEAAGRYEGILGEIGAGSALTPLVRLNLAQSYEELQDYEKALAQYKLLKPVQGFSKEAYLALGRVYVLKNETAAARQVYEEYLNSSENELDPDVEARIQARLTVLNEAQPEPTPQTEKN
jgi:predicted negative regulator of RcsB-dependent stress response